MTGMRAKVALGALCAGLIGFAPAPVAAKSPNKPTVEKVHCDRACLQGMMDQYLAALVRRDHSSLPLTSDVLFTENSVRLNLGEGLWNGAEAMGPFRTVAIDPLTQQVGFIGSIREKGVTNPVAIRLKIYNGRISEIETAVARRGMTPIPPTADVPTRTAPPMLEQALTPGQRVSRDAMIAAANQYFEGIEQNDGNIVPFHADSVRVENGLVTCNNRTLEPSNHLAMRCRDQFNQGGMFWMVPERRFWLVDEERGLVFGAFRFETDLPDTPPAVPKDLDPMLAQNIVYEMFKIKDGEIHHIEAVLGIIQVIGQPGGW